MPECQWLEHGEPSDAEVSVVMKVGAAETGIAD